MNMLTDPDMKEIVLEFCEESKGLFQELEEILEVLEDDYTNAGKMEEFGQIIDRIMGAAKTMGANDIATLCELGKTIGYKASQTRNAPLLEIVVAILFDTIDILNKIINNIENGIVADIKDIGPQTFVKRLKWLSDKFKDIERSSVTMQESKQQLDQANIDDLMSSLGL